MKSVFAVVLGAVAWLPCWVGATGTYYYGGYAIYSIPGVAYDAEISRLRDDLRRQQLLLNEQSRLNDAQLHQLRDVLDDQQRLSAEQACYYRMTGGFEACEDMFETDTETLAICEEKVKQRNPGCAG